MSRAAAAPTAAHAAPAPVAAPLATRWEFRRTQTPRPRKLLKGLDALVNRVIGHFHTRRRADVAALREEAAAIVAAGERLRQISTPKLKEELAGLHASVRRRGRREISVELRRDALAALCEAAWRVLRLRPYPEQIMGVLALERGCLAEMATGEGKTLTIGVAAALAAWRGGPVHVITANDYLVRRDAEWLREFYGTVGVSAGYVTGQMSAEQRRIGYAADITYATSKEVVADFLRDRLQMGDVVEPERRMIRRVLQPGRNHDAALVMRGLATAIIDEADHVLIDEAVTPLIISREAPMSGLMDACRLAASVAEQLEPGRDYAIDATWKDITLRESAREKVRHLTAGFPGLWRNFARSEELILTALKAREFFKRGQQYVVDEKQKIVIVDESTGRLMPQRTWKQGLHQAIEAKEGLPLTAPSETLARLSFQRYFRLYPRLCGLTGTAREARAEFWQIYALPVALIPTHKPCIRRRPPDRIYRSTAEKWQAVLEEIRARHEGGAPVLVGTRSVEASEQLAALLREQGLEFELLNAVLHEREANIIALAGQARRITIATNMAGRGTDIRLEDAAEAAGGLCVIGTEAHESGRVDRQLFGRAARQGEPGTAHLFICLEDDLIGRYLRTPQRRLMRLLVAPGRPTTSRLAWQIVQTAQRRAQKLAQRQRRNVLAQDEWLEESLSFARVP